MSTSVRLQRGITLLELLVVMMILSLILTAAVKTWDVTLERGRFQSTQRKLDQLVDVIVGNPDYIVAGNRVDFGYIGDMGKFPDVISELVVDPAPGDSSLWRGPYIRATFNESPDGYRVDGWGDTITYNTESLFVRSYGGAGAGQPQRDRWITREFGYSEEDLMLNTVSGRVLDVRGVPPPDSLLASGAVSVLFVGPRLGRTQEYPVIPYGGGQFQVDAVPQGNRYELTARVIIPFPLDTITSRRQVTVYPGVGARDVQIRLSYNWNDYPQ